MKLVINGIENEMIFKSDCINILEISDVKFYAHILEVFYNKVNGIESNEIFFLDDKEDEINMTKEVYFCSDLFNFDYNNKKILTKLYKIFADRIQLSQEPYLEELIVKLRSYIITEVNELPFDFSVKSGVDLEDIFKLFDIKIDKASCSNIIERIELLIELISTLKIFKVLVIPNLKLYVNDKELLELYKYSLYNNVNLLLIERFGSAKKSKYENILYIDENFNDFIR